MVWSICNETQPISGNVSLILHIYFTHMVWSQFYVMSMPPALCLQIMKSGVEFSSCHIMFFFRYSFQISTLREFSLWEKDTQLKAIPAVILVLLPRALFLLLLQGAQRILFCKSLHWTESMTFHLLSGSIAWKCNMSGPKGNDTWDPLYAWRKYLACITINTTLEAEYLIK